jgi:RNA polymerase sigma factor (sigma-70 family)
MTLLLNQEKGLIFLHYLKLLYKCVCLRHMDDEISDENLMLGYCSGDAGAFEVLYQRHKGPLYRFILRQCGQAFVEELFQDIWLKVIKSRMSYQVKSTFKTWLYHIARNRIIDHYRRQNIRPLDNDSNTLSSIRGAEQSQPENQLETDNQHELLMLAIAELPQDQRETFLLKEEAGLGIEEIASTTGVSYEAAKSRLRYAFTKLRAQLEFIHEH